MREQRAIVEALDLGLWVAIRDDEQSPVARPPRGAQPAPLFERQDERPDDTRDRQKAPAPCRRCDVRQTAAHRTGVTKQPRSREASAKEDQRPSQQGAGPITAPEVHEKHVELGRECRRDGTRHRRLPRSIRPDERYEQSAARYRSTQRRGDSQISSREHGHEPCNLSCPSEQPAPEAAVAPE
jgi:hypothetical protein